MKFRILLLFLTVAGLRADNPPGLLGNGEELKYRVSWGIFGGAGEIVISGATENTAPQAPQLKVRTTTSTRGFIRGVYPFDGEVELLFDGRDGRILTASGVTTAGKKKTNAVVTFDYVANLVRYTDHLRPHRNLQMPIPEGNPTDFITSFIRTRSKKMEPGDRFPATVMFDDEFYALIVVAEKYERVRTPWGEREALILVPTMPENPQGIFKRGGRMRVWVSRDEPRLPVKFEVAMKFGTGVAHLTNYRPPTPAGPQVAHAHPDF